MQKREQKNIETRELTRMSLFTGLMCLCAWMSIPAPVPFTLQTFAVFLSVLCLGAKSSAIVIVLYLVLGSFGLPVFSAGMSGPGVLFGANGGYMLGWFFCPLMYWLFGRASREIWKGAALFTGLILCYICGTLWYSFVYGGFGEESVVSILAVCVFPFVLPDIAKLILAMMVYKRVSPGDTQRDC